MNKYIGEAKKYYEIAVKEIDEAKHNHNVELAVDGCEKAWLSLNLAVKAMFIKKGVRENELPRTYRGMVYFLVKYGDKELRKMFDSARSVLHIDGFYERSPIWERVEEVLDDIKKYIKGIER